MKWLKYSGFWLNFVLNPFHWLFEIDFGGTGLNALLWNEEEEDPIEFFWCHFLLGPINFRIVIDDGKSGHTDGNSY